MKIAPLARQADDGNVTPAAFIDRRFCLVVACSFMSDGCDSNSVSESVVRDVSDISAGSDVKSEFAKVQFAGDVNSTSDIDVFLKARNQMAVENNKEEFIDVFGENVCARTHTAAIDTKTHIPLTLADNQEGPLSRSVIVSTTDHLVSPHGQIHGLVDLSDRSKSSTFDCMEERVRNIETHLGIVLVPVDRSLMDRVKILEDKILRIEQFYPQIAAHVFNYGRAETQASNRPGGRVSRPAGSKSKKKSSKRSERDMASEGNGGGADADDLSSLSDLKRRMNALKSRLLDKK